MSGLFMVLCYNYPLITQDRFLWCNQQQKRSEGWHRTIKMTCVACRMEFHASKVLICWFKGGSAQYVVCICLYTSLHQFTRFYKYILYLSCTCSSCNYSLHLAPLGRHVQIVDLFWIPSPVEQEHPAPAEGKHSENPPWVSGYLAPNERPQQHPHRVAVQNPRSLSSVCSTYRHHDIFMLQHAPQIPKH